MGFSFYHLLQAIQPEIGHLEMLAQGQWEYIHLYLPSLLLHRFDHSFAL